MDANNPAPANAAFAVRRQSLSAAYVACERLARRHAGNFYYAFLILPPPQRRAMCALYAFMRIADDLVDEPGELSVKEAALGRYRAAWQSVRQGETVSARPELLAVADTVRRYALEPTWLEKLLDGVAMDLRTVGFADFTSLFNYCYHVASVVGLCCIRVWGAQGVGGQDAAISAGIAFQLTNILRDVAEDARQGRVYLPEEALRRSGATREMVLRGEWNQAVRGALRLLGERAREHYASAVELRDYLPATGRAIWQVMHQTYRGLFDLLAARDFDPGAPRARLSRMHKTKLFLLALPVRFGWVGT